jgi:hypothetical protein
MLNPRIEGRFSGQTFTTNTISRALRRAASQAEEATYQARILRRDKASPIPPQLTSRTGYGPAFRLLRHP